jgi:LPXTG-motif cell wall-anchored protein
MARKSISHLSKCATAATTAIGASLLVIVPATAANAAPADLTPATTTTGAPANPLGTAKATAGEVDLDLNLLGGLLGSLHLTNNTGIDVPLANLMLGQAIAPTPDGQAANFTNSTVRLRDNLIAQLHLPGPEANLLDADAASGTARVVKGPGGYAQAYATVTNLRLFLPLVNLPGADPSNGVLKIDLVSAQATCTQGQKPVASAKMPTTILLLGHEIPVPLTGDVPLDLGPLGKIDVHLSPTSVQDTSGASAAVEARITVDAIGVAKVSGAIILASASCTSPAADSAGGAAGGPGGSTGPSNSATTSGSTTQTGPGSQPSSSAAPAAGASGAAGSGGTADTAAATPLAETGTNAIIWPLAAAAAASVLLGSYLFRFRRRIKEEDVDKR